MPNEKPDVPKDASSHSVFTALYTAVFIFRGNILYRTYNCFEIGELTKQRLTYGSE
jgi:hypothetical protein